MNNKKTCIISFSKPSPVSSIASHKIALFLRDFLSLPMFDDVSNIKNASNYNRWIVINLPFSFCNFQQHYINLIKANPLLEIVWVQNDYTIPNRSYKKYLKNHITQCSTWSNMPHYVKTPRDAYINWNMLTYHPRPAPNRSTQREGVVYWGAFRKDRISSFKKFFSGNAYPLFISTASIASAKKFYKLHNADHKSTSVLSVYPTFKSLIHTISNFQATIYMEDEWSTLHYNSPANRFYEALSAGLPMFFEEKSRGTFKEAGYDIDPYIVKNQNDVLRLLNYSSAIAEKQYKTWNRDYITELKSQITEADKK